MDWDNDPELQAMRGEFVDSFAERREKLLAFLARRATGQLPFHEIRIVAHNLAGSAVTYGFPALSRIAAGIDDYLAVVEEENTAPDSALVARAGGLLAEALDYSIGSRRDAEPMGKDTRLDEITSAARSLGAEPKP